MRTRFAEAAATYDAAAVLAREVGARMGERLDYIRLAPRRLADIGCATGDGVRDLQRRYPKALPLAIDLAPPMLRAVAARTPRLATLFGRRPRLLNADVNALPLAADSLDLIWSNLMLHWLAEPLPAMREMHRVLAVDGLLMFAALGPDTLKELRAAAKKLGAGEAAPGQAAFLDMHDLGDRLLAAGFADPVVDQEIIRIDYSSARRFLADQRQLGVCDALLGQRPLREWRALFVAAQAGGRLPLSFEIIYGHAWKTTARPAPPPAGPAVLHFHPPR